MSKKERLEYKEHFNELAGFLQEALRSQETVSWAAGGPSLDMHWDNSDVDNRKTTYYMEWSEPKVYKDFLWMTDKLLTQYLNEGKIKTAEEALHLIKIASTYEAKPVDQISPLSSAEAINPEDTNLDV